MPHTIKGKIREWSRVAQSDVDFFSVYQQIEYLADNLFYEYEPCSGAGQLAFRDRLRDWLDSTPLEDDQKTLLQLVPFLFFIGSKEFDSLYETAFNGPIARWLIDMLDLKLNDPNIKTKIESGLSSTWFCGITDSFQVSKFYHINHIEGSDLRSDWRTLQATDSSGAWVERHMRANGLTRVVLLEDFVGSGSQIGGAVDFATRLPSLPQILICPLVVCPTGADRGRLIEQHSPNVSFAPVLELNSSMFLSPGSTTGEPEIYNTFRDAISRLHSLVSGSSWTQDFGPFGFNSTGGLTIMHTNCPDNTLPLIHHDSDGPWKSLFPRASRLNT